MAESDSLSSVLEPPLCFNSKYEVLDLKCKVSCFNEKECDSNSEGIINALRILQEKIRHLESDKTAVSRKFEELKGIVEDPPVVQTGRRQKIQAVYNRRFSVDLKNSAKASEEKTKRKDTQHSEDYCRHYHLKLRDIPFILGMSTTPSHSLFANYQQLLAIMKRHGPLCQVKSSGVRYCQLSKHCIALKELSSLLSYLYDEVQQLCREYENHHLSPHTCQCEGSTLCERKHQFESTKLKLQSKLDKTLEHFQRYILSCQSPFSCIQTKTSCSDYVQSCSETVDSIAPDVKCSGPLLKKLKQVHKTLCEDDLHWK